MVKMNTKRTSKDVASLASKIMKDESASKIQKVLAGSALSQRNKANQTGAEMEEIASKALRSNKYNDITKELAGSVLAQSNKKR
jgi:hypothetical protein